MCCNCLLFWQQVICFKSLNLEQVTSKYSERLYLCLNNYHCNLNSKFNHLFHSLNVIECTLGCQYISVTLYLLQTYPSGKPLFKDQDSLNLAVIGMNEFTVPCIIFWKKLRNQTNVDKSRKTFSNFHGFLTFLVAAYVSLGFFGILDK